MWISASTCRQEGEGSAKPTAKEPKIDESLTRPQVSSSPSVLGSKSLPKSTYELGRDENIRRNKAVMKSVGLEDNIDSRSEGFIRGAETPSKSKKEKSRVTPSYPAVKTTPTRSQLKAHKQEIRVVLGGELHCSNPLYPDNSIVFLPLSSLNVTRVVVWPGTSCLNGPVGC